MTRRRKPRWTGWYGCEFEGCDRKFRRGADYAAHGSKHFWAGDRLKDDPWGLKAKLEAAR